MAKVSYSLGKEDFVVGNYTKLFAGIGVSEGDCDWFHFWIRSLKSFEVHWRIVRQICGIHPANPNMAITKPEQLVPQSLAAVLKTEGMSFEKWEDLRVALSRAWAEYRATNERPSTFDGEKKKMGRPPVKKVEVKPFVPPYEKPPQPVQKYEPQQFPQGSLLAGEIWEMQRELLYYYGFHERIFNPTPSMNSEVMQRSDEERQEEINWFCDRLLELRKMFDEPMAKVLARQALLNELQMRRLDDKMSVVDPEDPRYWGLTEKKQDIEKIYQGQWNQLKEICPFIHAMNSRVAHVGLVSEWIESIRAHYASGDNTLIDGLFTALELQVELRKSVQNDIYATPDNPDATVRYRPSVVLAVIEAKMNLFNPAFKPTTPKWLYKTMDAAWRAAADAVMQGEGKKPVDLEREGEAGEYENLVDAAPEEQEEVEEEKPAELEEPGMVGETPE